MSALAALLIAAFVPQDEARLKEAWPKLAEAWKSLEPVPQAAGVDPVDSFLSMSAKLHDAFEAAGLFALNGEYVPQAFKAFIKSRVRAGTVGNDFGHALFTRNTGHPMQTFLDSMQRLKAMERDGFDDEDNIQDELSTARKALKALGVTADATPSPLRRRVLALTRALAAGEGYPDLPRATEEQAAQFRAWIGMLGHDVLEDREQATRDLKRAGEKVIPFLREALGSPDAETVNRVKQLLGFGHEPWTAVNQQTLMSMGNEWRARAVREDLKRKLAEDLERLKARDK